MSWLKLPRLPEFSMGNSEVVVEPNEAELTTEDTESTEEETQLSILIIL
jgi:hypothetical protein